MSNVVIGPPGAGALPTASTIDAVNDYLPIYTASASAAQAISRNTLLGLGSAPAGLTDSQTLTNKVLTSPTISGPTLSGTIIGTYTIGGTPTFPASVVTLTGSQTLTNKVLTSPTINSPSITNATISTDTITGYSSSSTGSIFGISVTSGTIGSAAIANSAITTALLNNAAVTPSKLGTGAAFATVVTAQTTASNTYTDLATGGPAVTVTIGANGLALVSISCYSYNSGSNETYMSYALTGANTVAAATYTDSTTVSGTAAFCYSFSKLLTGLTAGSTTFTAKYATSGGTAHYQNRNITVVPL